MSRGLEQVLCGRLGHDSFRPNQREVCEAVVSGRDAVVVMPTGSGKSLCYQLPGLVRGGSTLVISPLIALMDDQVAKLRKRGVRAEALHSGRGREESREVFRSYLRGELEFLFIAPERLAVPRFVDWLVKQKPELIAVDEAHCISHWGHDFRPDYRLIGEYLPALRPAPVVALTATATVRVQQDIVSQLGLCEPMSFIRGFRRTNLALEGREVPKGERAEFVEHLLSGSGALPAIVYVPTRKEAEALALELPSKWKPVFYHAGSAASDRSAAQTAFMSGQSRVVVATVAFGMGIDKSDIRTIIHTSLPGSIEQYYQEVGRAGRDGALSRAVLLYSSSDRRMLESFHALSYPAPSILDEVLDVVPDDPVAVGELPGLSGLDEDVFEEALRQLHTHGAVNWSPGNMVSRCDGERSRGWRRTYLEQRGHRLAQIDDMMAYATGGGCRMNSLVSYFSREEGRGRGCGLCDDCAPADAVAHGLREPSAAESKWMGEIILALKKRDDQSCGKLYKDLFPRGHPSRSVYDDLVAALVKAGLVEIFEDRFENGDHLVCYNRVKLCRGSGLLRVDWGKVVVDVRPGVTGVVKAVKSKAVKLVKGSAVGSTGGSESREAVVKLVKGSVVGMTGGSDGGEVDSSMYERLRVWRSETAVREGIPPFRVAGNAVLKRLVAERPDSMESLQAVKGIGRVSAMKYGSVLLRILGGDTLN